MRKRLAVVPARGGSKRIPRKNIVPFCGQPLISYALNAASSSDLFDEIHVSTEDDEIAGVAAALGFAPVFRRDPSLSDDHTPILAVLKWVVEQYQRLGKTYSTISLIMPTAPLLESGDIADAIDMFDRHNQLHPVLGVTPFPVPVEWALKLTPSGLLAPAAPEKTQMRSQDLPVSYYDSGMIAVFSAAHCLAPPGQLPQFLATMIPKYRAIDIDTREDLELAEYLYRGQKRN